MTASLLANEEIFLKTSQQAITRRYFFKLFNGRIKYKKRRAVNAKWQYFGKNGLPASFEINFNRIKYVSEISADGDNLIALSGEKQIFYSKISKIKWNNTWGKPVARRLHLPENVRAWSISHRWGKELGYYEDIAGKKHYMGAGVTTFYILDKQGHEIYYADPWLPPRFGHNIAMPLKGRFIAINMSVSGSTIFIINQVGEMYTRLYDFDTSGQNPFLKYTYDKNNTKDIRTLPAETWRKQPRISGDITDLITILQTGKGNAARELRVEGTGARGKTGYYYKKIYAGKWNFKITGRRLSGKKIDNSLESKSKYRLLAPVKTQNYQGTLSSLGVKYDVKLQLLDYSPYYPPARLRFIKDNDSFEIPVYFRHILKFSGSTRYLGTLVIKGDMPYFMGKISKDFFKNNKFIELKIIEKKRNILLVSNMKKVFFQFTIKVKK